MKPIAVFLGATMLALSPAGPAEGGQEPVGPGADGSVRVTGKYQELVGHDLRIVRDRRSFRVVKNEHLQILLSLVSHRDNVRLTGKVISGPDGSFVEVQSLEVAESDAEMLRRRMDEIEPSGPDRSDRLASLVDDVARNYSEHRAPEVLELAREAALRAIKARSELQGADAASYVRWIRDVHALLGDGRVAFELLVEVDRLFPRDPEVARFLRELNCRRHGGRWVTYDEFKKLEGFVLYEGKWIKPHERDFTETLRAFDRVVQTNLILRKRTEREYKVLAETGKVDEGMRPDEVVAALGPPERVERRLHTQKEFDQWIYGEKYYYFYGGLLVKKP